MKDPDRPLWEPIRSVTLGEAKQVGSESGTPEDTLSKIESLGERWSATNISLVEWTMRALLKKGHDLRGQAVGRLLDLSDLHARDKDSLKQLACGGSQEGLNFNLIFGPICQRLVSCPEIDREYLANSLGPWAFINTLGVGPSEALPLSTPEHPFLDYLAMAPDKTHILNMLGSHWARYSVEEDEYGLSNQQASDWALARLLEKGVSGTYMLREVLTNGGHEERQQHLVDQLLRVGAADGVLLSSLPLDPARPWLLEIIDAHPRSWRNQLNEHIDLQPRMAGQRRNKL